MIVPQSSWTNREWLRNVAKAAVIGALGAFAALGFVGLVSAGQSLLWPDVIEPTAFSGSWRIVAILTGAGLVVGVIHHFDARAREVNVFIALGTGEVDRRAVPGGILIALVALIGGFSLGPEVPTGMAAAGLAAWWGRRRRLSKSAQQADTTAAITGAWGGLFTTPFVGTLLNVELSFGVRIVDWRRLSADATAAIAGFTVFFGIEAGWSETLRLISLEPYDLRPWHLLVAVGLGVAGAILGTLFKMSALATRRLASRFKAHVIVRSTLVGLVFGLIGLALPLTLFLGTEGLVQVTQDPKTIGIGVIVVSAVVKLITTSSALSFGFVGGPVFPLLFAGGALGTVLHVVSPGVPEALAVIALMAAVPAAVIPVPMSLAALSVLIGGVAATEVAPVFTAAFVAFIVGRLIEAGLRRSETTPQTP